MLWVMHHHNTPNHNPALDQEILSHGGVQDERGRCLDIHETLFHSPTEGFYLRREIWQGLKGRTWETLELGELDDPTFSSSTRVRFLKVQRPMSRDQVMRFVINAYMPSTEGIREEALRFFEQHGAVRS
jgi:hypothetical protein